MTRFKCPMQQRMYEKVRELSAAGGMPNRFYGSSAEAYWHGRNGSPKKYLRTSLAYAAFAAGRDDRKVALEEERFSQARGRSHAYAGF